MYDTRPDRGCRPSTAQRRHTIIHADDENGLYADILSAEMSWLPEGAPLLGPTSRIQPWPVTTQQANLKLALAIGVEMGTPVQQAQWNREPVIRTTLGMAEVAYEVGLMLAEHDPAPGSARGVLEALMVREGLARVAPDPVNPSTRCFQMTPLGLASEIGVNAIGRARGKPYTYVSLIEDAPVRLFDRLGWQAICSTLKAAKTKRERAEIVQAAYGWLPVGEQARLAGYTDEGWRKLRRG